MNVNTMAAHRTVPVSNGTNLKDYTISNFGSGIEYNKRSCRTPV